MNNRLTSKLCPLLGLVALMVALLPGSAEAQIRSAFANQWMRDNPFTVMALNQDDEHLWANTWYEDAGMNNLLSWFDQTENQVSWARQKNMSWQSYIHTPATRTNADIFSQLNQINNNGIGFGKGWMVHDEPDPSLYPKMRQVGDHIKANYPGTLVYSNLQLSDIPGNLDNYLNTFQPDLLMYDEYPFKSNGSTNNIFDAMMDIRSKAQQFDIPYWGFVQAAEYADRRLPSESDIRMQAFSFLATGYKGLAYFGYRFGWADDPSIVRSMLERDQGAGTTKTPLYAPVAAMSPEIVNLGETLKNLTSTDVRYVQESGGTPGGLTNWSTGAGGVSEILNIGSSSGNDNALAGFFTNNASDDYFMLVNLQQGPNQTAASAARSFVVDFDTTITQLEMVDRATGATQIVPLTNNTLNVTLPGGTGNLYRILSDPPVQPGTVWEFDTAGDLEGWTANPVAGSQDVSGGTWNLTPSGSDPILFSPAINVPSGDKAIIEIAMSSTGGDVFGQIFWTVAGDLGFSEQRSQTFTVVNDGSMQLYEFDFSSDPDWTGNITQLRFDPTANGTGGNLSIDFIRLLSESTVLIPGDFNGDDTVDNLDLSIWQTGFGQFNGNATLLDGDADEDGYVGGSDFLIWQANFGTTAAATAAQAVPEPPTLALALLLLSAVGRVRCRS